uniref:PNPLA domain-containing protein n=1 Tax=Talaromyces marneffei PM1 TaxID=1077442 RepID=A0A093VLB7_TALMA
MYGNLCPIVSLQIDTQDTQNTIRYTFPLYFSIIDAALATSAAPLYLPPVKVNGIDFWDDGLLNNNPIDQVWSARHDLAPRPENATTPVPDRPPFVTNESNQQHKTLNVVAAIEARDRASAENNVDLQLDDGFLNATIDGFIWANEGLSFLDGQVV